MLTKKDGAAIILLHEIYGKNKFIKETCLSLEKAGYYVEVPDLLHRNAFTYEEADEAYSYFINQVSFSVSDSIIKLSKDLKLNYSKVYLLGFSVGATLAWKCCEAPFFDGIICCYGSRIRDYMNLTPNVNTLLLFANHDSFDVNSVVDQLNQKPNISIARFDARHGFIDSYSNNYDAKNSASAIKLILEYFQSPSITLESVPVI